MSDQGKPRKFGYFFAEILILIFGISISFLLNEWRLNKQQGDQEQSLLRSFKDNLVTDSLMLHSAIQQLDTQVVNAQKVIAFEGDELTMETLTHVVSLLNYVPFSSNDITYEEMKSVGSSRIIQNDSLIADLIGLYENNFEIVKTWSEIDGEHVRQRLIPYVETHFPFAPGLNFMLVDNRAQKQFLDEIQKDNFKHLVQFGMNYKATASTVIKSVLANIRKVISKIEKELPPNASSSQKVTRQENAAPDQ